MRIAYCQNCGKSTGHKRALGAGTIIGAVITGGASLLALPFYSKRCIACGLNAEEGAPQAKSARKQEGERQRDEATGWLVLLGFMLLLILTFRYC
jgi:hypothetical protein